jgi:hypothetical protein
VVDRQSNAPAAFTPGEIRGTHFQRLSRSVGCTKEKIPSDATGDDPGTSRLVAQYLNHYGTPGRSISLITQINEISF